MSHFTESQFARLCAAVDKYAQQQINPMPPEPSYPCCGDCKACEHRSRCVTDCRIAAGCSIV